MALFEPNQGFLYYRNKSRYAALPIPSIPTPNVPVLKNGVTLQHISTAAEGSVVGLAVGYFGVEVAKTVIRHTVPYADLIVRVCEFGGAIFGFLLADKVISKGAKQTEPKETDRLAEPDLCL